MRTTKASSLSLVAGLTSTVALTPALAAGNPAPRGTPVPTSKAGVLYLNLQTGERSLTLYPHANEPELVAAHRPSTLFDYWMSIDENPCWDAPQADGFGWNADATNDVANGVTEPIAGFDFGDLPFDSKITGVLIHAATLATEDTDSNSDGTLDSGLDTVAVYYDALSEGNATSVAPPTAAVRIESIPGNRGSTPNGFDTYDLILDFGSDWFELGDSDGTNRGPLWIPGANAGADVTGTLTIPAFFPDDEHVIENTSDGLADFQYLQYYAKHGSDNKVTSVSTFIGLGTPEGQIEFTTYSVTTQTICPTGSGGTTTCSVVTVITETVLVPDPLPQGQGVFESFGIAALGSGADTTTLDYSVGGCCFWYGGLDCVGFLDNLQEEPEYNNTWYGYNAFAQNKHALFSDSPTGDPCAVIDFNGDTYLDSGDISTFVQLFLQQDLSTDLNGDGVTDNGDITIFVTLFLTCTG